MANGSDSLFRFSDSVKAFYSDPKLRSAVEFLVDGRIAYAPETVDWDKVETFYDACLSARQVQVELAKDLFRLWMAVWSPFPPDWTPVPADPRSEELSLDPAVRWYTDYFERQFTIGHRTTIAIWVSLGDEREELDRVQIAFDVRHGDKSLLKRLKNEVETALPSWEFRNSAMRKTYRDAYRNGLDLRDFRKEAQQAFAFVRKTDW